MTNYLRRRGTGNHRADDRIAELEARHAAEVAALKAGYEQQLGELREENVALHNRLAGADDFFMIQDQYLTGLEGDVRQLTAQLAEEQGARAVAEADAETRSRWIGDLERQLAEVKRRLEIRVLAEQAVAQTQELDVRELRNRFTSGPVVTLHNSPQARRPDHVPAWAKTSEEAS